MKRSMEYKRRYTFNGKVKKMKEENKNQSWEEILNFWGKCGVIGAQFAIFNENFSKKVKFLL